MNKEVNGKQCVALWHVDNPKISHKNEAVSEDIVSKLNERHGKEAPLPATQGKIHDCLGMTMDHMVPGKVIICMDEHIDGILAKARADMGGSATSPAADHPFDVDQTNTNKPSTEDTKCFHMTSAKLLFVLKCSRPDIQQAVAFLTTRV